MGASVSSWPGQRVSVRRSTYTCFEKLSSSSKENCDKPFDFCMSKEAKQLTKLQRDS